MSKFNQISVAICSINEYDELVKLNRAIIARMKNLSKRSVWKFTKGDKVTWVGKRGAGTGVVTKAMTKNVLVTASDGTKWRIPAAMLKSVEA